MLCNKKYHFESSADCFDNDLMHGKWKLEHNAEELQEILNRIMQGIVSMITSALIYYMVCTYRATKYSGSYFYMILTD